MLDEQIQLHVIQLRIAFLASRHWNLEVVLTTGSNYQDRSVFGVIMVHVRPIMIIVVSRKFGWTQCQIQDTNHVFQLVNFKIFFALIHIAVYAVRKGCRTVALPNRKT